MIGLIRSLEPILRAIQAMESECQCADTVIRCVEVFDEAPKTAGRNAGMGYRRKQDDAQQKNHLAIIH